MLRRREVERLPGACQFFAGAGEFASERLELGPVLRGEGVERGLNALELLGALVEGRGEPDYRGVLLTGLLGDPQATYRGATGRCGQAS